MTEYEEEIDDDVETIHTDYVPPSEKDAKWVFDYENLYWQIKAQLMGGWLTTDKDGKVLIKRPKGAAPLLNKNGIEETMSTLVTFITKIGALTVLTEERILQRCLKLANILVFFYAKHHEDFGVEVDDCERIIEGIMGLYEDNLRKSIGGKSLTMIGTSERTIEHKGPQRKRPFF